MPDSNPINSTQQAESVRENHNATALPRQQQPNNQSKSNTQRDSSTASSATAKPSSKTRAKSKQPKSSDNERHRQAAAVQGNSKPSEQPSTPTKPEFKQSSEGLIVVVKRGKKSREVFVCSPVHIVAASKTSGGMGWGRLILFKDSDGITQRHHIELSRLETEPGAVRAELLSKGLRLGTSREAKELFSQFLIQDEPKHRVKLIEHVGWHGNVFVFNKDNLEGGKDAIILQAPPEAEYRTATHGSIDDWKTHIGARCVGNSRLLFGVSCAFASALLTPLGEQGGGFHLEGGSSTGKSTALLVAGSVWGGGGQEGFVRSWNTTRNAVEPLAVLHNDMLLPLDEFGLLDARDAGEVAYILAEGRGKQRASKTGSAMRSLNWRVLVLSTGEIGLEAHVEAGGKKVRAGQAIRFMDLAADAQAGMGLFEDIHLAATPAEFAEQLKRDSLQFYGTAIREFIRRLIGDSGDWRIEVGKSIEDFLANQVPSNACGEVRRAARRFAIVAAAGELATDLGITGWTKRDATRGVGQCFTSWLADRSTTESSDDDRAVRQVVSIIEAHDHSRFKEENDYVRVIYNCLGYKKFNEPNGPYEYQFLPEVFRTEVCRGFDYKAVIRALRKRGMMAKQAGKHLTVRRRIGGQNLAVYAVAYPIRGTGE